MISKTFNGVRAIYLAVVCIAWIVLPEQSAAQPVFFNLKPALAPGDTSVPEPVNPARCSSGDKNFIYWAAKEQVFRFAFDPKEPIYVIPDRDLTGQSLRARQEIPPPPNPKEPEGCYDNPLRGLGMPYIMNHQVAVYEQLTGRRYKAGLRPNGVDAHETEFGLGRMPTWNESIFEIRKSCWIRNSGIQECLINNNPDRYDFTAAHIFTIPRTILPVYPGYRDIRFIGRYALTAKPDFLQISSNFKIFGSVLINLSIIIKPDEIDLMIPYHRETIKFVINAHVAHYSWRDRQ